MIAGTILWLLFIMGAVPLAFEKIATAVSYKSGVLGCIVAFALPIGFMVLLGYGIELLF